MDVLVIDIGGSFVKVRVSRSDEVRRFASHPELAPSTLVFQVQNVTRGWHYDVISLGFPGVVAAGEPAHEPGNLGDGWLGFDFAEAFGVPVRVVNDAVMQALGAYEGGRMLFLGLGTGLGSALITEHVIVPLELGNLYLDDGRRLSECLGLRGLETNGMERWMRDVHMAAAVLHTSFVADYVVLGGGNAERVDPLPEHARRGANEDAFIGGFRLWEEFVEPHDREPHRVWRVVR